MHLLILGFWSGMHHCKQMLPSILWVWSWQRLGYYLFFYHWSLDTCVNLVSVWNGFSAGPFLSCDDYQSKHHWSQHRFFENLSDMRSKFLLHSSECSWKLILLLLQRVPVGCQVWLFLLSLHTMHQQLSWALQVVLRAAATHYATEVKGTSKQNNSPVNFAWDAATGLTMGTTTTDTCDACIIISVSPLPHLLLLECQLQNCPHDVHNGISSNEKQEIFKSLAPQEKSGNWTTGISSLLLPFHIPLHYFLSRVVNSNKLFSEGEMQGILQKRFASSSSNESTWLQCEGRS